MNKYPLKKLGEVCDVLDNKRKPITKRYRTSGKYPYYGATGILDYVSDYIFDEKLVLIGEDGAKWESGDYTAFIAEGKYWVNNHAHVIRPHRDIILDNWIIYFFYLTDVTTHTTGLTVPKLNQANLRNIQIPLPPLPEQLRIVSVLNEALEKLEQAKESIEKNLQNSKEVFESYLQNVFANPWEDWKEKRLGEVCNFFNGFAFQSKDSIAKSNTQLIRMGNLYQNHLDLERRAVYYPDDFAEKYQKFLLKEDDLIISLTGTTGKEDYGYTVRIPQIDKKLLLNQRIAKVAIIDENQTVKDYLLHFLLSRTFLDQLYKTANGTRQANLSTESMRDIPIMIPKKPEQLSIVSQLNTLSTETKRLESIYQQKLAHLDELRKSLLQKAFNGEL